MTATGCIAAGAVGVEIEGAADRRGAEAHAEQKASPSTSREAEMGAVKVKVESSLIVTRRIGARRAVILRGDADAAGSPAALLASPSLTWKLIVRVASLGSSELFE